MADIRVRVGQPDLHVNVGQQDAIKVLASNTAVVGGAATFADIADYANTAGSASYADVSGLSVSSQSVTGVIASVTQLYVSGISSFSGNVYFNGNIIGNLTSIDGGSY